MKKPSLIYKTQNAIFFAFFIMALQSCSERYYSESDYYKVPKIDANVRILTTDSLIYKNALAENLRFITLNVNNGQDIKMQLDTARTLMRLFPGMVHYLAVFKFDSALWNTSDWGKRAIEELENNISGGAVGVNFSSNIGMRERERSGKYIMISNSRFDTVISWIEKKGLPLSAHFGEPKNCWMPIDSMTVLGDKSFFRDHPIDHGYLHPEYPSYEEHLKARDSMLTKHPNLRFLGCHLATQEWSVDELAKTLDRFPNMAVDMGARICHLEYQSMKNCDKVRNFLIKYQDRILYGCDIVYSKKDMNSGFFAAKLETRLSDWNYFTGPLTTKMSSPHFKGSFTGLHLPKDVIDKLFYKNAVKWYKLDETGFKN